MSHFKLTSLGQILQHTCNLHSLEPIGASIAQGSVFVRHSIVLTIRKAEYTTLRAVGMICPPPRCKGSWAITASRILNFTLRITEEGQKWQQVTQGGCSQPYQHQPCLPRDLEHRANIQTKDLQPLEVLLNLIPAGKAWPCPNPA